MPKLSEAARFVRMPDGIVTTGWPRLEAKGKELGFTFDEWQQGAGRIALGRRASGKYACTVGGVTWSIPRQVGKTYLVGAILILLCILFPSTKCVWTAHRTRTSTNTFKSMQGMCRRKKVAPFVESIRTANGEQEIVFHNGSVILFGAREQGFGRGFDVVDFVVYDEAQILTEKALEDIVPATNQSQHPHGALIFFIGTPPRPTDPGEVFTNRRRKALDGKAPDAMYLEFSADEDAELDDHRQWRKANPSHPKRTPLESMLRMRENLGTDEAWSREAMGRWDRDDASSVFGPGLWDDCAGGEDGGVRLSALTLAVSIDAKWAAIGGAGAAGDTVQVKPLRHGAGTDWVIAQSLELQRKHRVPLLVDGRGPGSSLIPSLKAAGVRVRALTTDDVLNAWSSMVTLVDERRLLHAHYPELDAAVQGATTRAVGDRSLPARRKSTADISPLEAVTLAAWWSARPKPAAPPPGPPQAIDVGPQHEPVPVGF